MTWPRTREGVPGRTATEIPVAVLDRPSPATPQEADARRQRRDKALLDSILSGIVVKLAATALSLVSVGVSARALGQPQFGVIATLSTLTGLMAFADLGIGSGLMTYLASATARNESDDARGMVATAFYGMLVLGLVFIITGVLAACLLPWTRILGVGQMSDDPVRVAVGLFFVCAGVAIPTGLGQRILMAHQKGFNANLWLLMAAMAVLAGTLVAARLGAPLWCFVVVTTGIPVVVSLIQSIRVFRATFPHLRPSRREVSRSKLRTLAGVSGLFFGLNVAVAVAYQSDALVVASILGAGSAGVFAIALRMFNLITGTLGGASQQMWTSMAEALARGDRDWVRSRLFRVIAGSAAISVPASVALVVLGRPIARAWVGSQMAPPQALLACFAIWTIYSLAISQVGLFLNAAHVVGPQLVMAVAMTIANIGLSIFLTHQVGLIGPIVASIASHMVFTGIPSLVLAGRSLARA
jgi:O-antigen/teichoic acid export membrane protein